MAIWDFVRRPDNSVIYEGMRRWDRRNPKKRTRFFEAKRSEYEQEYKHLREKWRSQDVGIPIYRYVFLKTLFVRPEGELLTYSPEVEMDVIRGALRTFLLIEKPDRKAWMEKVLPVLREERAITELLPALFDGRLEGIWESLRLEMEAQVAAARKAIEEKKAYNELLKAKMVPLEDELRRLNMIYQNNLGADFMTKAKLVTSIEATENAIARLRASLRT